MTTTTPTPPDHLPPAAREKFAELAAHVAKSRLLSPMDVDQLVIYSDAWATRQRAAAALKDAPLLIRGSNGNDFANPLCKVVANPEDVIDRVLRRLHVAPDQLGDKAATAAAVRKMLG